MAAYKPARLIDILIDDAICSLTLGQMRASHGFCPLCGSRDLDGSALTGTKAKSESLLRCWKCGQSFAFASGTFVMSANQPLIRYVQLYVLHNALGAALTQSSACLATGATHGAVIKAMLHRISLVDPGIRFAIVDATLARKMLPTKSISTNSFVAFCEMNSIVIDEGELRRSLEIAIGAQVPELIARYKDRGPRKPVADLLNQTDPDQAARRDVAKRKAIAFSWQKEFGKIAPMMSGRMRTGLAWRLANLNIATNESLASLQPGLLTPTGSTSSSLLIAREQYLKALARHLAVQTFVRERSLEGLPTQEKPIRRPDNLAT